MSSQAQFAANRANAQLSTGPRTPQGKAVSSMNNFKLGLACRTFAVLDFEDQEAFDNYGRSLLREYDPQTTMERTLVMKIAQHHWLSQRAFVTEQALLGELGLPDNQGDERRLALCLRYQSHHDRAFHKTRNELDRIQAARHKRTEASKPSQPKAVAAKPSAAPVEMPEAFPESPKQQPAITPAVPINSAA